MKIAAMVLVSLMAAAYVGADVVNNGHMWYWQDDFGDPLDAYVEAYPGDTVTVWHIANNNGGQWVALRMIRTELWWDTAVIANPGSGDGSTYITPIYGDPAPGFGSHVTDPPHHNYTASPDYSTPQYNYYLKLDFWATMWAYEGMAVNGYEIPIRPDALPGETTLGGSFIGLHKDFGSIQWFDTIDAPDPFVLTINVLPEPGDFDLDGDVDADDIDILCDNMGGDPDPYDVDEDGGVDEDDLVFLIETLVEWDNGVDTGVGTMQGDFNLDGIVNATDLAVMKGTFGTSGVNYADGNANCDELVNATDLAILKGTFGFTAPTGGGVPEPMTIGLLAMGGMGLLRSRSKIPSGRRSRRRQGYAGQDGA